MDKQYLKTSSCTHDVHITNNLLHGCLSHQVMVGQNNVVVVVVVVTVGTKVWVADYGTTMREVECIA